MMYDYDYLREGWVWLKNNFLSVILLLVVIYSMASGNLKKLFGKLKQAKNLKAGPVELAFEGMSEQSAQMFQTIWRKIDDIASCLDKLSKTANEKFSCLETKVDEAAKQNSGTAIDVLKLMFYNSELNEEERLIAGLRYVAKGKNHQMRDDVIDFAKKHKLLYRGICTSKPHYRIPEVDKAKELPMPQGIQATLKNETLKRFGCYFLCLLKWLEVADGMTFDEVDIEEAFQDCIKAKLIHAHNAFVLDAVGLVNFILGKTKYSGMERDIPTRPAELSIAALTRSAGDTHFLVQLPDGTTWDTLPPDRPAAKTWSVGSYRILV